MSESVHPQPATDAAGFLPGTLGLRLDEGFLPLTALHASASRLDQLVPLLQYREADNQLFLRFSPQTVWCNGPLPKGDWRSVDISHAMTHLRLRGVEALHFLAHYTMADLLCGPIRKARVVRTRLNQYDCAMWWGNTRDIHILTDRSLAQSLCDHLCALALRHAPADETPTPRPMAPDAPDRRG